MEVWVTAGSDSLHVTFLAAGVPVMATTASVGVVAVQLPDPLPAELLQVFLMGRGYGVSPQAAMDAAGRVEISGCSMPVLQHELENLALVM